MSAPRAAASSSSLVENRFASSKLRAFEGDFASSPDILQLCKHLERRLRRRELLGDVCGRFVLRGGRRPSDHHKLGKAVRHRAFVVTHALTHHILSVSPRSLPQTCTAFRQPDLPFPRCDQPLAVSRACSARCREASPLATPQRPRAKDRCVRCELCGP